MEYIGPLIQTILWVLIILLFLVYFHKPIHGILTALQKRIESGSNIKAGWFELSGVFKPQNGNMQIEKATLEIQDVIQEITSSTPTLQQPNDIHEVAHIQQKYLQAEDLVLRAIQEEYGSTISRQVTAGQDIGFDGIFLLNGRLNIVEVKYVSTFLSINSFRKLLNRLEDEINRYKWKNVQIIFAVVFEKGEDAANANNQLVNFSQGLSIPVVIRCYSYVELLRKFGISGDSNN